MKILIIRKVPEIVHKSMNLNEDFSFLWNPEVSSSILGLGYSFYFEFIEYFAGNINKHYNKLLLNKDLYNKNDLFIKQEWAHALAHKNLNEFINLSIPPCKYAFHPRVYDFMFCNYKIIYEPLLEGVISDKNLNFKNRYLKSALKEVAIFESKTCVSSFVFFEQLFDNGLINRIIHLSKNLGILYLLGYHFTEELEHCDVAIDLYEKNFNEKLWSPELLITEISNQEIKNDQAVQAALYAAKLLNVKLNINDIENSSYYKYTLMRQRELIKMHFHPNKNEILKKRKYFIEKWDNDWEPKLLSAIQSIK